MRRIGTFIAAATTLAALLAPSARATAALPVIYAHRGGAAVAPENTLGAFRQAQAQWGARGVWLEMDTQPTKDGVLVIIHDDSVDRTTNCSGYVIQMTHAEIEPCDARVSLPSWPAFEHVPTAREVLNEGLAADWRIMIELKDIPGEENFDAAGTTSAALLAGLVKETQFPLDHLLVQSFWPPALDAIERELPGVGTVLLTTYSVGLLASENAAYAAARGYEVSSPDEGSPDLSATSVAAAHALGRVVVPWTVDSADRIRELRDMGVDGIISNNPELAYATLEP